MSPLYIVPCGHLRLIYATYDNLNREFITGRRCFLDNWRINISLEVLRTSLEHLEAGLIADHVSDQFNQALEYENGAKVYFQLELSIILRAPMPRRLKRVLTRAK